MPLSSRPKFKGLPTPYVAGAELKIEALRQASRDSRKFDYRDPIYGLHLGWIPEEFIDWSKPKLGDIYARRQFECAERNLCQICGDVIKGTPNWIIKFDNLWRTSAGELITADPPLCDGCVKPSQRLCPRLKILDTVVVRAPFKLWGFHITKDGKEWQVVPYTALRKYRRNQLPNCVVNFLMMSLELVEDPPEMTNDLIERADPATGGYPLKLSEDKKAYIKKILGS